MKKPFVFSFSCRFFSCFCTAKNEAEYLKAAPFKMAVPVVPTFAIKRFFINGYSAVGDGQTLTTTAFARAVAACAKAGGGKVVVPAGLRPCSAFNSKQR